MESRDASTPFEADCGLLSAAAELLVDWYLREARDLPWRRTADPYAILVSEVMLQQTRVDTVRQRWVEFLERFPTLEALAQADEESVLAAWSGLGYYRRARNLHRLAREVVAELAGRLPASRDELRALPGIGEYTSAAVAAIAFGAPALAVDGNVARVAARLLAIGDDLRRPALRRELEAAFAPALDAWPPGELNQALMELGARVCLPRAPRCGECPCESVCRARARGIESEIPPRRRREIRQVVEAAAVLECAGSLLLVRGQRSGQLADMWEFPTLDSRLRAEGGAAADLGARPSGPSAGWTLARELADHLRARGLPARDLRPLGTVRHGITNRRIECLVYRAAVAPGSETLPDRPAGVPGGATERAWLPRDRIEELPLAAATRKILDLLDRPSS